MNNDLILLFQRVDKFVEANFNVTMEIKGRKYPIWERPFVGLDDIYWKLLKYGIPSLIALLITICCCCCICNCCCKCCVCCNCKRSCCCKGSVKGGSKVLSEVEVINAPSSGDPASQPNKGSKLYPKE